MPSKRDRTGEAIRRMSVSPLEVKRCPPITPMLKRILKDESNARVADILRFSSDPVAQQFLACYDNIAALDSQLVSLEHICVKAQVATATILGLVLMNAVNLSSTESALQTVIEHPEVVRATISFAKNVAGASKDREMLHQAVGFIPSQGNKTPMIPFRNGNTQEEETEEESDSKVFESSFPTLNQHLEKWSDKRRKLLEAPSK